MLVATPGQTTAYALHNNNSGNTTTTANNIPTASAVSSAATSTSCSVVTASKKQATLNNSSSMGTPKSVNNNSHIHNNTSATTATAITANNHNNFHAPPNKKELNNLSRNPSITASSIDTNSQQQHSFKNSDISRPSSFLSALKDSVQKALVTTASSLPRNGSNQNATATALNTSNTTSNNTSTKPIIASASSSSSLSVATTKNSSNTIITTAASSSSSSASTILPLPVARKKFVQAIATQPKLHTIPPTILHRYPEERQKASSTDSLQKEMCHFKPIRTAPTTPWKSGSKSRGSSLRFPKANLATTKSEFILKSICDVNNRKKRQQSKVMQTDQEILGVGGKTGGAAGRGGDADDNDEQENKQYFETYKPKPSPLYSPTSLVKPNHQSAFVCLVTNLMNIQPTKSVTTPSAKGKGDGKGLQKSKSTRVVGRQKEAGTTAKAANITEAVKELFVRTKKFKSPLPPQPLSARKPDAGTSVTRSQRSIGKSFFEDSQKMAKINELPTKVTKSKSRRKLKGAKSNIMDDVQFTEAYLEKPTVDAAVEKNVIKPTTTQRNTRKRKAKPESSVASNDVSAPKRRGTTTSALLNIQPTPTLRNSTVSARKNSRLSAESNISRATSKHSEIHLNTTRLQNSSQRINIRFSPPLTRSRLKKMQQNQQHSPKGSAATSLI